MIGRFTQEDEYRGDGLNLYAYCGNNPVIYWDSSGYARTCKRSNNYVKKNEVTDYYDFRERSKKGDKLEGHELLQHAFLRDNYLIPNNLSIVRLGSKASCKNPVIALPSKIHKKVNKLQKEMVPLKGVTGRQHI